MTHEKYVDFKKNVFMFLFIDFERERERFNLLFPLFMHSLVIFVCALIGD